MQIEQMRWTAADGWKPAQAGRLAAAQLVIAFGASSALRDGACLRTLTEVYPRAALVGCSTAGEISGTRVSDESVVATAVELRHAGVRTVLRPLEDAEASHDVGRALAEELDGADLAHVLVLSEGLQVNGSSLVRGLVGALPRTVQVTGGLAGDGERFGETFVFLGPRPLRGHVAAVGFYGSGLRIGYGSLGGWDPFGPERLVTRSEGNVLFELDGRSALELYKKYLGDYARDLPASALLFPLALRSDDGDGVVRTVLSIDERQGTMTFAGDLPEGSYARLMKANFERLIDGATLAARTSYDALGSVSPELALLISCVGRRMVLRQRIEEEVESVREVFGDGTVLTGFYSYGEISPFTPTARCELHNQTMTITTFRET